MHVARAVPILTVSQLRTAVDVYVDVLGCEVLMDHGWIVTLGSSNGGQLSLMEADLTAATNPEVSLEVDDVDEVHAAVVDAGLAVVHPLTDEPWGVRRFFFTDPDGRVVNVLSHR